MSVLTCVHILTAQTHCTRTQIGAICAELKLPKKVKVSTQGAKRFARQVAHKSVSVCCTSQPSCFKRSHIHHCVTAASLHLNVFLCISMCEQATALVYFKRFHIHHCCMDTEPSRTMLTCIYLAAKVRYALAQKPAEIGLQKKAQGSRIPTCSCVGVEIVCACVYVCVLVCACCVCAFQCF